MKSVFNFIAIAIQAISMGCGDNAGSTSSEVPDAPTTLINAFDVPIDGLPPEDVARFDAGDADFGLPFRPVDGLGPLYIRTACSACHVEGGRGPGLVQKMVVVDSDGVTPAADQSALPWGHTIRQGLAASAITPIVPPTGVAVRTSIRIGPPVVGRGYLEAIADSEIERVAAAQAQRSDGIHGRVHRVTFTSVPDPDTTYFAYVQGQANLIGRFGTKARIATLDDFTADAFQGDMGMTTPMRPSELPNPDGLTDDLHPGVDLPLARVQSIAFYVRHIAIPRRVGLTAAGAALFEQAQCTVCHVPALRTRASYPITQIADVDAEVYTDLLLHDMGDALADSVTDGEATGRLWKTSPLIGLRFFHSYLHDGRAATVEDAILAHDGEGRGAADVFRALAPSDRATLVQFVEAL